MINISNYLHYFLQLKKMGNSGLLMRSNKLDESANGEDDKDAESSSEEDDVDASAFILPAADPATSPRKSEKGSGLTVDSAEANGIRKMPSQAGELIVSDKTSARTPTGGLVTPKSGRKMSKNLLEEGVVYQRSKSDSRSMNAMVAPSPKAGAKQILEDAMREIEPVLPPIRMASKDQNRTPLRQFSRDNGSGSLFNPVGNRSSSKSPRPDERVRMDSDLTRKILSSSDKSSTAKKLL